MAGKYPDPTPEQRVDLINRVAKHVYAETETFLFVSTSLAYLMWAIADYDSWVDVHADDREMKRLLQILDKDSALMVDLVSLGLIRPVENSDETQGK